MAEGAPRYANLLESALQRALAFGSELRFMFAQEVNEDPRRFARQGGEEPFRSGIPDLSDLSDLPGGDHGLRSLFGDIAAGAPRVPSRWLQDDDELDPEVQRRLELVRSLTRSTNLCQNCVLTPCCRASKGRQPQAQTRASSSQKCCAACIARIRRTRHEFSFVVRGKFDNLQVVGIPPRQAPMTEVAFRGGNFSVFR